MISIIICSINTEYLEILENNIKSTIGIPFELIVTDNRFDRNGICSVYNKSVEKAIYPIICFIHEDVYIHSNDWGKNILAILSNREIGLVGVSGAVYKSSYPGTWPCCVEKLYRVSTIQHYKGKLPVNHFKNITEDFSEVAVIDGVFMVTTKAVIENISFDSKLLKGFHGYDIDISLAIGQQYKIVVSNRILLEHFSEGTLSESWLNASISIHKKWQSILPVQVGNLLENHKEESDYLSITCVLRVMMNTIGYKKEVFSIYLKIIFKYLKYNKLKYTRKILLYFLKIK